MNAARLASMATPGIPLHRRCTQCGSPGPFPRDRRNPDGLHSWCKRCNREAIAARRAANPSKARAQSRGSKQRQHARDPEHVRAMQRRWYARHKDEPALRADRRARSRAFYAANREQWVVYRHLRRARKSSAGGFATAEQIRARVAFYGGVCAYCGGPFEHVDHVIALSRGGSNWPANLRPACARCNLRKHTRRAP